MSACGLFVDDGKYAVVRAQFRAHLMVVRIHMSANTWMTIAAMPGMPARRALCHLC